MDPVSQRPFELQFDVLASAELGKLELLLLVRLLKI